MSAIISPSVDEWRRQTESFNIIIVAYNKNNEQCINEDFYIQYNITYDGTEPGNNVSLMEKKYSDATGIFVIPIKEPCIITLYATWKDDENSFKQVAFCVNQEITFMPVIESITAICRKQVEVSDTVPLDDIIITAFMSNGEQEPISPENVAFDSLLITHEGENIFHVILHDSKYIHECDMLVVGVRKLLSITATYTGAMLSIGQQVQKNEVIVLADFLIELSKQESDIVPLDKWHFVNMPIVSEENGGNFQIKYQTKYAKLKVDSDLTVRELDIIYDGKDIEVGKNYNKKDVVIFLWTDKNHKKQIDPEKCEFSSTVVAKDGINWYTITYTDNFIKYRGKLHVKGYVVPKYVNNEFKIWHIEEGNSLKDCTEDFLEYLWVEDLQKVMISWESFLKLVKQLNLFGLFKMYAPKNTGLLVKYDTLWRVYCNEDGVCGTIIKVYDEEMEE